MSIAFGAAKKYLAVHSLKADEKILWEACKSWVKIKLPEAMKDAKEAAECGMDKIATQTFGLSIAEAGIEAAKECGWPLPTTANVIGYSIPAEAIEAEAKRQADAFDYNCAKCHRELHTSAKAVAK